LRGLPRNGDRLMNYWLQHDTKGLVEDFTFRPGKTCMNCGERKTDVDGGWCGACLNPAPIESPCACGCLAKTIPHSAYVDYWSDDK
jgi:hypothetical protein